MKSVADDVRAAAEKDVRRLLGLGATLLALTPPAESAAEKMDLVRVDESSPPTDQYREPWAVFLDGKPLSVAEAEGITAMPNVFAMILRNTDVDDAAVRTLLSGTALRFLIVQNVPIGDQAVLGSVPSDSPHKVFFEYTDISNAGAEELLKRRSLTMLSLRGTKVDDRCLASIPDDSRLGYLDVSETRVGDEGLRQLARLQYLHWLSVSNLNVTAAGFRELANMRFLGSLDLYGIPLDRDKLDVLMGMKRLVYLRLNGSGISDAEFQRLKAALPMTTVFGI